MGGIVYSKLRIFTLIIAAEFICQIIILPWSTTAKAETNSRSWSWATKPNTFSSVKISDSYSWCTGYFQTEKIDGELGPKKVCLSSTSSVKFGTYFTGNAFLSVVGFPLDSKMYRLNGICEQFDNCLYLPDSDTMVTKQHIINNMVRSLVVYKNFTHRLSSQSSVFVPLHQYNFDSTKPDYIFSSTYGYAWPINGIGASDSGKWLAVELRQRGIGLLNMETFEMRRISSLSLNYGAGSDPTTELAVSNDGQSVAVMGINSDITIIEATPECGYVATDYNMATLEPFNQPCKTSPLNTNDFISRFHTAFHPRFNDDGGGLNFYALSYAGEWREVSLRATGYESKKLGYLALGDSFTSGEGETDDKYYLAGTNDKYEKCHVSIRSYPFLISDFMKIEPLDMASVACSGATTADIVGTNGNYYGQGERLKDINNPEKADKTIAQTYALYKFIPGRIHQETFVSEYNPKIITVGIGGNDAGLMEKLSTCAGKDTCNWASNAEDKEQTADEIKSLFGTLVKTYQKINAASPESKIYAIGYPKIIDQDGKCDAMTGFLFDKAERRFMNESIIYLNQIIEAAAKSVGIRYINIQDSFGNHVLCGNESPGAMNSVRIGDDNQYNWLLNIGNESFHPNSLGHIYDAAAINKSVANLMNYSYCYDGNIICPDAAVTAPEPSTYWIPDIYHDYPDQHIASDVSDYDDAVSNQQKKLTLNDNYLAPDSPIDVEITSDPVSLGHFTATSSGSLNVSIDLPNDLAEGYHTIHLYGTSYSGEPIELYQIIEYKKPVVSNPADATDSDTTTAGVQKIDTNEVATTASGGPHVEQTAYSDIPEVKGASVIASQTKQTASSGAKNGWIYLTISITALITATIVLVAKIIKARKINL